MGYAYFLISLVLVPATLALVLRRRWMDPVWAAALAITLLPAVWATLVGVGAAPCHSGGACVTKAEQHRQLVAAPAVLLILLGVTLLAFGVKRALVPCAIAAGVLTAVAETKSGRPGFWFLVVLVLAELAYVAVPVLQRRAEAARPPNPGDAAR